jgi:hypothetical protein
MHSAAWDDNYDLSGKTVAVIGGGSSAVQIIPKIQPGICGTLSEKLAQAYMGSGWKIDTLPQIICVDHDRIWCKVCRPRRDQLQVYVRCFPPHPAVLIKYSRHR